MLNLSDAERVSGFLRDISAEPGRTSDEKDALKLAALAMLFTVTTHPAEFNTFRQNADAPLTPDQKGSLKKMGLEDRDQS